MFTSTRPAPETTEVAGWWGRFLQSLARSLAAVAV
jgi:hypothetical protein